MINNFETFYSQKRPQNALNRDKKEFEIFTYKQPFQFEKMKMNTNEKMNSIIQQIIQRADSALDRNRNKKQNNKRIQKRIKNADRDRDYDRRKKKLKKITNESHETDQINQIE